MQGQIKLHKSKLTIKQVIILLVGLGVFINVGLWVIQKIDIYFKSKKPIIVYVPADLT